jgi:hypothetical protein
MPPNGGSTIMKKFLLTLLLAMPLVLGLAAAFEATFTAAYADPPDPKPK